MKEKLSYIFGSFGIILYYLILTVFSVIPFIILEFPLWLILVLTLLISFLPLIGSIANVVFYILALVKAVSGPQDFITVLFYVFFALYVLYFLANLLFKSRRN